MGRGALLNKPQVYALLNKSDLAAGSAWKKGHLCLLRKALSRPKVLDLHCELSEESAPRLVHRTLELRERWKMARDGTMGANMGPRLFFAVGICIRFQGSKGVCPGTSAEDGPAFSALYIYSLRRGPDMSRSTLPRGNISLTLVVTIIIILALSFLTTHLVPGPITTVHT